MAGQEGNDMKIYVIGTVNGKEFAGHMTKQDANWMLDTHREVSKAEYRAARAAGMPSYGEHVTTCKHKGCEPMKRTRWVW